MMIKAGQILSFDKELENTRNQSLQELVKRQDIREFVEKNHLTCLLYTSPSPRDCS